PLPGLGGRGGVLCPLGERGGPLWARGLGGGCDRGGGPALARSPAASSEAVHPPLVGLPDARVDRVRQLHRHHLVGVPADHFERSNRGVQIVPPLLLQFAVRVQGLRIRIDISRRLRKVTLYNIDCRNAMMTWLQSESCARPKAESC